MIEGIVWLVLFGLVVLVSVIFGKKAKERKDKEFNEKINRMIDERIKEVK